MAFEVLKTGNVGVGGSTGTVLHRSLMGSRALISRSLAEVRLTQGVQNREQFLVAGFIDELALGRHIGGERPWHQTDASCPSRTAWRSRPTDRSSRRWWETCCRTPSSSPGLARPSRSGSAPAPSACSSRSRTSAAVSRVANVNELFRPFEQRSADRTGLGLGLAFSRWGAEANNGRIYARNLPGRGCVFTVDLPRLPVPAVEAV